MFNYSVPIKDMVTIYESLMKDNPELEILGIPKFSNQSLNKLLLDAEKFAQDKLVPINGVGDREPSFLENGVVRTPPGFKEAYDQYTKEGWIGLTCEKEHGGEGLPKTISGFIDEIWSSSNLSFKLFSELTIGAYNCIYHNAKDEIRELYLPKMARGDWGGTMCLTEEQCGTDLGLIKTLATPVNEKTYSVQGQKIYITSGDQDLTENVIHLVLAKTPNAPEGTKGLSLFLVPKIKINQDGSLGDRNNVRASHVFDKMGIRGVPTCAIEFDNAEGILIGNLNEGLKSMFVMMNIERIKVGLHGLGLSEVAFQQALSFSKSRKQGRNNEKDPLDGTAIINHPDIKRQLLTMKSLIEGERALAFWLSIQTDLSLKEKNLQKKEEASDLVALMTPVVKSFFTDLGSELTSLAIQIHGGRGYMKNFYLDQFYRDNRITSIYEGTNAIQALDLIYRKIGNSKNDIIQKFFDLIENEINCTPTKSDFYDLSLILKNYLQKMSAFTTWLRDKLQNKVDDARAGASDFQLALGYLSVGYVWIKFLNKLDPGNDIYKDKLDTAKFYFSRILTRIDLHYQNAKEGSDLMMDFHFKDNKYN